MKQYAILYVEEKTGMTYYYDLDERCLYQHNNSEGKNKGAKAGAIGGKCGGIVGLFIYPFVGTFACNLQLSTMLVISILAGWLGAMLLWRYGIYYTSKLLNAEEKQYFSNAELLELYKKGRKARLEKNAIELFLLLFGVVVDVYAWIESDKIMLIIAMALFWGMWALICTYRPICTLKWKQQMRKNSRAQ